MQKLGPMTLLFHSIKSQSAELKLLHLSCFDGSIGLTRGTLDVTVMVSSVTLLSLTSSTGGCLPKMILVLCEGPWHQRRLLGTDGKWLINLFLWTTVWPFEWKRPVYACLVFACLRVVVWFAHSAVGCMTLGAAETPISKKYTASALAPKCKRQFGAELLVAM